MTAVIAIAAGLFALGMLFLLIAVHTYVQGEKYRKCDHKWSEIDRIGVWSQRNQINEAIIYVRQCEHCKLTDSYKVAN